MSAAAHVVTEQRGSRFVAPGFVALACAAAVARVVFGGSRTTATMIATVLLSLVGLAALGFCVYLVRAGRSTIVVTADSIRWEGVARADPPAIDRSTGDNLIIHIAPGAFSRQGGQQYHWELVTPGGEQRIDLQHFDHRAVAEACRQTGWNITEGPLGRVLEP
ncbi:MAG TPA: hypothetical protein VMM60_18375 [Ilumatobacter sp.]|nr:hypothetical protein [Ilumatobacter sp.]